jgi:SAM-dependent methyltransferase
MRRATAADELLDGPLDDANVLTGNLRDLARANRWLGGSRLSGRAIEALIGPADPVAIVDVGTGGADIPLALIERARDAGRDWRFTAVDSRPEVLAAAAVADRRITATPELTLHVGDGRSLGFPDGAFDIAHTSLVIHHLAPDEAVALLAEMRRVARRGVVVNDLVRGRLTWLGAWALAHGVTRNRFTRHDAPLSVERAYSRAELEDLLAAAGLAVEARFVGAFGHRWAVAARPATPARPASTAT